MSKQSATTNAEQRGRKAKNVTESFLVTPDGLTLKTYRVESANPNGKTAFLTHSQAQHSENLLVTAQGLAAAGYTVHLADLRGHGRSSGPRAPLGHMDMETGWERLVSDLRLALDNAFKDTGWEDRLIIAPNIGAALILEILKTQPDLAKRIVLASPTPNQPQLLKIGQAFTKARLIFNKPDKPDALTQHQLYRFLGLQLNEHSRLIDVMSSDTAITDSLLQDPFAWPTPTTGYFHEMFKGLQRSWNWRKGHCVHPGTRCLILYGGEDPVVGRGQFIGPIRDSLQRIGFQSITLREIPRGRSGLIIDEEKLGISRHITAWSKKHDDHTTPHPVSAAPADEIQSVLGNLSLKLLQKNGRGTDGTLRPEELVELCYTAVNDERHWAEMFYHLALRMSQSTEFEAEHLDALVSQLMPHFERSYELSRQVMQSVVLGSVLQDVIDRFGMGMAIVNDAGTTIQSNRSFDEAIGQIFQTDAPSSRRLFARLLSGHTLTTRNEALILHEDTPIAFYFKPPILRQIALQKGGGSGVVLIRQSHTNPPDQKDDQIELLRLAYKLTQKEAEVTLMTLSGVSQDEGAAALNVSINTFKTHLRSVYEKLQVRGQSDLTSTLLNGPFGLISH